MHWPGVIARHAATSTSVEQPDAAIPRDFATRGALPRFVGARIHVAAIAAAMTIGTLLHYGDLLPALSDAADASPVSLAYRQSLERILFLAPVMYAGYVFGLRGGLPVLAVAGAIMLPRAVMGGPLDHAVSEVAGILVVGALATLVIRQQQRDVETQRGMRESLGDFVRKILAAQEEERHRIALELHDDTAQALLVISQRLDSLSHRKSAQLPIDVTRELNTVRASALRTLAGLRRMSQGLRPRILDDYGLEAALEWLADQIREDQGLAITVDVDASLENCDPNTQLLLFRIAQEAARNVARHAGASRATISIRERGDRLMMTITDDGRGFAVPHRLGELTGSGRLGLAGMSERVSMLGGTLAITSSPGHGSEVRVVLRAGRAAAARASARADPPA